MNIFPGMTRDQFPELLVKCSYKLGVEVGVQRGDHAVHILSRWPGELYLVDPWKHYDDGIYVDQGNCSDSDHEIHRKACLEQVAPFGSRATILRQFSADAAELFDDGAVDFVYIDANHSYDAVLADLVAWHSKIRRGGLLSGHDYTVDGPGHGGCFGVKPAVHDFMTERGLLDLYISAEEWPTWYCFVD